MPVFVNGQTLVRPQAVSTVLESASAAGRGQTSLIIALLATADGGTPREFESMKSFAQLEQTYRSGAMVDLARRLYEPSRSVPGAYEVRCYRLNLGVQATGAVVDGGAADVITLASADYGLHTSQIRWKIEAGTTAGYKPSVQGYDSSGTITRDNVQRQLFSVEYTGAGTSPTVTVSATQLTTAITGAAGDQVTLAFSSYTTVQALADALTATGVYAVTMIGDGTVASTTLDVVTAQSIAAAYTLKADIQAVVDWFNNESGYIEATRVTGAAIATSSTYANLTGGSNGAAVTTGDYQTGFTALQAENVQIVVVESTDSAVHAQADQHVHLMSQTGGNRERIAIVGGAAGETVAATITRAQALASDRTALVYPGIKDLDSAGAETTLSPVYSAAAVAGLLAGAPVGEPATRKGVRCLGPASNLTPSEVDQLLLGGVVPIEKHAAEGARVAQSISTYYSTGETAPISLIKRELSIRLAADRVVSRVRDRLDNELIGRASGPLLAVQARTIAESSLVEAKRDGLIVGDDANPAYEGLEVRIEGEAVFVSFAARVVSVANYVVVQARLGTYGG